MRGKIIKNKYTCCIIGHEANKLPWGLNEYDERCIKLKDKLKEEILNSYLYCYDFYMFDPSIGLGLIFGDILFEFKQEKAIELICVLHYLRQTKLMKESDIFRFTKTICCANTTKYFYEDYINGCIEERNKYMIDNSDKAIFIFDGSDGNTKNAIEYAKQKGIAIEVISLT